MSCHSKSSLQILFWIAWGLLASGCSINTFLPANRFDFPETHGEWLWSRVQVRYQGTTRVELFQSYTDPAPVTDQPVLATEGNTFLGMALSLDAGISRKVDFFLKAPIAPAPALMGVKIQMAGHHFDKRQAGDLAASLTLAGGYARQEVESSATGGGSKLFQTAWAGDVGLIAGWRPLRDWMIYGGPFFTRIQTDGQITQTAQSYQFSGQGNQVGGNLGITYNDIGYGLAIEYALVDFRWSYERRIHRGHVGLSINKEF